jgi:hypothetical protein
MALYDKNGWYNNLFGGSNVFGAGPSNTDALVTAGLISQEDIDKAQKQSLMRGLLGTAVSYISQPKNQGYGSALPYLGKAFMSGMEQAQSPYDNLVSKANMEMKMREYTRNQKELERQDLERQRKEEFEKGLFQHNVKTTTNTQEFNPELYEKDQAGNYTQLAPNFNPIKEQTESSFDSEKYLRDSLQKGLINGTEYFQYHQLMNPTEDPLILSEGSIAFDNKGKVIAKNPKAPAPNALYDTWMNMGGPNSEYKTFGDFWKANKTLGGTNINVNNAQTLSNKTFDTYIANEQKAIEMGADNTVEQERVMEIINNIDNGTINSGMFTDATQGLNQFLSIFGVGGETNEDILANTQVMIQNFANAQLKAGEKLKGMPSDREQDLLKKAAGADYNKLTSAQKIRVLELQVEDAMHVVKLGADSVKNQLAILPKSAEYDGLRANLENRYNELNDRYTKMSTKYHEAKRARKARKSGAGNTNLQQSTTPSGTKYTVKEVN